jgi:hypothetical protein
MSDSLGRSRREAQYIYDMAPAYDMRTGQLLFNSLKHEIAEVVRNTSFDPFYKDMELEEIVEWLEDHIIYDNQGMMVRLFSDHRVLWEEEQDAA